MKTPPPAQHANAPARQRIDEICAAIKLVAPHHDFTEAGLFQIICICDCCRFLACGQAVSGAIAYRKWGMRFPNIISPPAMRSHLNPAETRLVQEITRDIVRHYGLPSVLPFFNKRAWDTATKGEIIPLDLMAAEPDPAALRADNEPVRLEVLRNIY